MAWITQPWGLVAAGFLLLIGGGEVLVRGSVAAARRMGVSPLLIGLTVVGFGTSSPELLTSLTASTAGSPGLAVGNVIGSNIANLLLVVGLAATLRPVPIESRAFTRDSAALMLAMIAALAAVAVGRIDARMGLVFLAGLVGYILLAYLQEHRHASAEAPAEPRGGLIWPLALTAAGILMTVGGARFLVDGALTLARQFGLSETVLGLTLVAVGTSLPELATTVVAAARGESAVALGNAIGSNIYNVLGILGITALVRPIAMPQDLGWIDLIVFAGSAILVVGVGLATPRLERRHGLVMLAVYAAYVAWLVWGGVSG
jgi:cation:H+ antiporter